MLEQIIGRIDEVNTQDPNVEIWENKSYPKELIYGKRMTKMLFEYIESPSIELQIAARGQHIRRWHISRKDYPMDRKGYLKWRTMLKIYHGELLREIMKEVGYNLEITNKVVELVTKKKLKSDDEAKQLEDVICLVFLKYYFADFSTQYEEDKIILIVKKTWGKMTEKGHKVALKLDFDAYTTGLVQKALKT